MFYFIFNIFIVKWWIIFYFFNSTSNVNFLGNITFQYLYPKSNNNAFTSKKCSFMLINTRAHKHTCHASNHTLAINSVVGRVWNMYLYMPEQAFVNFMYEIRGYFCNELNFCDYHLYSNYYSLLLKFFVKLNIDLYHLFRTFFVLLLWQWITLLIVCDVVYRNVANNNEELLLEQSAQ